MSGVVGVFGRSGEYLPAECLRRMLAGLSRRGSECFESVRRPGGVLAVVRNRWEMAEGFSGPVLALHEDPFTIVADASLFYREELRHRLTAAGSRVADPTPTHLILAAYKAWGEDCVRHLEGDYAFVIYEERRRRVFAARSFDGKRPLFYARLRDTLVVSSSISAILAHPDCSSALNVTAVAEDAALLTGSEHETAYREVTRLPAAWALISSGGMQVEAYRHWQPPRFVDRGGGTSADTAAEELRTILCRAADERLAPSGVTSIWLSGGLDSPALFASGRHALREANEARLLEPISLSYPPGDPGREDELITDIVRHWDATPHWLDVRRISTSAFTAAGGASREEPFVHLFEGVIRALCAESRAKSSRVAWDGNGGDLLFEVSDAYLADLLGTGQLRSLAREWRAGGGGAERLLSRAVRPVLSRWMSASMSLLPGKSTRPYAGFARQVPEWVRRDFVRQCGLDERERAHAARPASLGHAAAESHWYLTNPVFPRAAAYVQEYSLTAGLEHRSPMMDARVVDFAARRPVRERRSGTETKRLLRHAMRGRLPDTVLAPRRRRTGTPIAYLERVMEESLRSLGNERKQPLVLAELGIVDADAFRSSLSACVDQRDKPGLISLWVAFQVELWLRSHHGATTIQREYANPARRGWAQLASSVE